MEYKDIRYKFAEISGRYDLVTATQEDNGADFFLNLGQKYLDRFFDDGKAIARYPVALAAGEYIAKTIGIRAIKEVWIANSEGKRELEKCTLQEIQSEYSEGLAYVAQGTPGYYAPALFRPYPDTLATITGLYGVDDLVLAATEHYTYNGVVIMPPPDTVYTLEIVGLFYSPTLSATLSGAVWTQTKSYWTEVHPETLIKAAIYQMKAMYHDSSSADYKAILAEDVTGLIADDTEQMLTSYLQMNG